MNRLRRQIKIEGKNISLSRWEDVDKEKEKKRESGEKKFPSLSALLLSLSAARNAEDESEKHNFL
jgi:hypothetical protein